MINLQLLEQLMQRRSQLISELTTLETDIQSLFHNQGAPKQKAFVKAPVVTSNRKKQAIALMNETQKDQTFTADLLIEKIKVNRKQALSILDQLYRKKILVRLSPGLYKRA